MTSTATSATRERGSARADEPVKAGPRRDVQGLRAFAVLAVILDHLTGWPGGGFVGVDMFFVISGFLITGLLLREHERTGHISFVGFYRRRLKRIIPAAVLVLVTTVIASYLVFTEARFQQTKTDAWWALLFAANWRYASEDINYFNVDRAISPVQHYWSLSIEEQFYFVWPWLMLAIFAVLLARNVDRRHAHVVVGAVIGAITVGSFIWAVLRTQSDAHVAYFSSFTRVWELGVGAFLAVASTQIERIPEAIRPALAWLGLGGMVASLWLITGERAFPAPAAALPVLATALVIAAGAYADGRQQRLMWPLTNRGSNYIGDMSYSLYLWHFPIIIIGAAVIGSTSADKAVLALVIAAVSYFSYELFENPLRHATWAGPGRRRRGDGVDLNDAYKFKAFAALLLVVVAMAVVAVRHVDPPRGVTIAQPTAPDGANADPDAPELPTAVIALQREMVNALRATSWPDLDPTIEEAVNGPHAPEDVSACGSTGTVDEAACTFGDPAATRTVVTVGDSISLSWAGVLKYAFESGDTGWQVKSYGTFGCPFTDADFDLDDADVAAACPRRKDEAVAAINRIKPDVVIWAGIFHKTDVSASDYADTVMAELDKISVPTTVVFLPPPPPQTSLEQCYTKQSVPADCVGDTSGEWSSDFADMTATGLANNIQVVNPADLFCRLDQCPPFVANIPTLMDGRHITPAYSEHIGTPALQLFRAAGLFSRPTN